MLTLENTTNNSGNDKYLNKKIDCHLCKRERQTEGTCESKTTSNKRKKKKMREFLHPNR